MFIIQIVHFIFQFNSALYAIDIMKSTCIEFALN